MYRLQGDYKNSKTPFVSHVVNLQREIGFQSIATVLLTERLSMDIIRVSSRMIHLSRENIANFHNYGISSYEHYILQPIFWFL